MVDPPNIHLVCVQEMEAALFLNTTNTTEAATYAAWGRQLSPKMDVRAFEKRMMDVV